jgi:transposase-like protein
LWLWRAVDDEGEVLDMLVQKRRNTRAATAWRHVAGHRHKWAMAEIRENTDRNGSLALPQSSRSGLSRDTESAFHDGRRTLRGVEAQSNAAQKRHAIQLTAERSMTTTGFAGESRAFRFVANT